MQVRVSDQQCVFSRTGQPVEGTLSPSLRTHQLDYNHKLVWNDFKYFSKSLIRSCLKQKKVFLWDMIKASVIRNFYLRYSSYFPDLVRTEWFAIDILLREVLVFEVACRVQIWKKKHFVKIETSLVTVLFKMTLYICIYFVFTKKPLF